MNTSHNSLGAGDGATNPRGTAGCDEWRVLRLPLGWSSCEAFDGTSTAGTQPDEAIIVRHRTIEIDATRSESSGGIPAVLSTDAPVNMGGVTEILDHSPGAVTLPESLPLLEGHDTSAPPVGVAESLRLDGGKLRGLIRFGSSPRAQAMLRDVQSGIVTALSVGYTVRRHRREADGTLRAISWSPAEVSAVGLPADAAAGFNRNSSIKDFSMTEISLTGAAAEAVRADRERAAAILDLGTRHNQRAMGERAIADGMSLAAFRGQLLDTVGTKPLHEPGIGLTRSETERFSLVRALRYQMDPSRFAREAGFELECSREVERQSGRAARGLMIPMDALSRRDLTVGTASAGGNLVATDLLAGSFIDVLRNSSVVLRAGATMLDGLVGNVAIPRKSAAATVEWVGENSAPTEGAMTFNQVSMTPKTVGGYLDISRRLLLQSTPAIEGIVRADLAAGIASAIDTAALHGTGTNGQPRGIIAQSGIGSVAMGTNGGAPTWASVVNLTREVDVDNALAGNLAFLTNAKVRAKLATTARQSSGVEGSWILPEGSGELFGYPLLVSNAASSTLTKGSASGVCSAMFFGNWSELVIGQWSGIDLLSDPFTFSNTGSLRVRALADLDIGVKHPESFAVVSDYLTT